MSAEQVNRLHTVGEDFADHLHLQGEDSFLLDSGRSFVIGGGQRGIVVDVLHQDPLDVRNQTSMFTV